MKRTLDKFTQTDSHGVLFCPSLQIALYAKRPLAELARGATACYKLFIEKYGHNVDLYLARSMRKVRQYSSKYAEIFPTLCARDADGVPPYRVFHGGNVHDFQPPAFVTEAYLLFSSLQLHLPLPIAHDLEELFALLAQLATSFPFRCGHVGYSLCWNVMSAARFSMVPPLIGPLHKRYPGFSLGNTSDLCDQPLPPVNWLTLLGPEVVKNLGGIEKVATDLTDNEITVMPMGAGICIRAGAAPQIGDRNRGDTLPVYRRVGRYLKDYRGYRQIDLSGLGDDSEAWLARFDT